MNAARRAAAQVVELRKTLSEIRLPSPQYAPGHEPTAADALSQGMQVVEHILRQIEAFIDPMLKLCDRCGNPTGPWPDGIEYRGKFLCPQCFDDAH